nr:hypothetical protein [Tanacetum cinerariifolium]
VNIPRSDEDRLDLMELTVFLLPSDEKVRVEVSAVDLQVYVVRLILLLLVQKLLLFGLTNWCCSLNAVRTGTSDDGIDQAGSGVAGRSSARVEESLKSVYDAPRGPLLPVVIRESESGKYQLLLKVNDVTRLQALVDKKKVVITKATLRDALRLDDEEGIECLPNEEIFAELARMGYEKPSTKLTLYKEFFSSQWKFLIHTILQLEQQVDDDTNEVNVGDVLAVGVAAEGDVSAADDIVPTIVEELSIPSPTPPTPPPKLSQDQPSTS